LTSLFFRNNQSGGSIGTFLIVHYEFAHQNSQFLKCGVKAGTQQNAEYESTVRAESPRKVEQTSK
jgi:hypothetical protein